MMLAWAMSGKYLCSACGISVKDTSRSIGAHNASCDTYKAQSKQQTIKTSAALREQLKQQKFQRKNVVLASQQV